jgi:nitrate reductase assembly molybdenum cofactor insertion protein NarJ
MPLTDPALEYLLQSAGLTLTDAEKADLQKIHDGLAAMKARVRQKRGPTAELAHTYGFTAEDLT